MARDLADWIDALKACGDLNGPDLTIEVGEALAAVLRAVALDHAPGGSHAGSACPAGSPAASRRDGAHGHSLARAPCLYEGRAMRLRRVRDRKVLTPGPLLFVRSSERSIRKFRLLARRRHGSTEDGG